MAEVKYKYNSIEEVEKKYRWDLEACLLGKTIEDYIAKLKELSKKVISVKESKYESKESYIEALKLGIEFERNLIIPYQYLSNKLNTNLVSPETNRDFQMLMNVYHAHNAEYGSETKLIKKNKKKLKEWAELPEFKTIKLKLLYKLENLKYRLEDNVEDYLTKTSKGEKNLYKIFSIIHDSEIDYGFVNVAKEKVKITNGNFGQLLENKNEKIRKTVYNNRDKAITKHKESSAQLLIQHLKSEIVQSKIRGFKSHLHSVILDDNVSPKLLETLFENVKKLVPIFKRLASYKKLFFEKKFNKKMKPWDGRLKLIDIKTSFSVEECQDVILKALSFMPKDYYDVLKRALKEERWVDYMNYPNKRSGAYSIGNSHWTPKKYILMNYDSSYTSVSTLAHELGHSMHSYFSDNFQDENNSQYTIFMAEIASVFNEIALVKYMLQQNKNDKEFSFFLLGELLDVIKGTVLRQTIWSNYETNLYKTLEKDQVVASFADLEKIFFENEQAYDPKLTQKKWNEESLYKNYCCIVPHFYFDFYVYKYALGFMIACSFYKDYEKRGEVALRNYIDNFLKAGSNDWPANILKKAGINIYSKNLFTLTFELLSESVNQYIKLGKEIFKIKIEDIEKVEYKLNKE